MIKACVHHGRDFLWHIHVIYNIFWKMTCTEHKADVIRKGDNARYILIGYKGKEVKIIIEIYTVCFIIVMWGLNTYGCFA